MNCEKHDCLTFEMHYSGSRYVEDAAGEWSEGGGGGHANASKLPFQLPFLCAVWVCAFSF